MKSKIKGVNSIKKIGKWWYDQEYGRFTDFEEQEFFLDNRLNKLLMLLVEKEGTILKREELLDKVWQEVHVNEESLTKGIFDLRKVLKEKEVSAIEILTIRNIGYRLKIEEQNPRKNKGLRLLLKATLYFIAIISFAIMFIRAIRYEN